MTRHTITLSALDLSITYSVKDNSPRGCHTVPGARLQVGDKIVIDNYFHEIIEETPAEPEKTHTEPESPATVQTLDLLDDLDTGDHGDRLNDYRDSDGYICDIIAEIADADTSIYYSDILDFIRRNPDSLADVIAEGLYDPSHDYDLYKHAQAAEFMTIERDVYDHLADALMCAAVHFIRYDLAREEIPAELADLLREWCDDADNNDRMNEIPDKIREWCDENERTAFDLFCESCKSCDECKYHACATVDECRAKYAEDAQTLPDFTSAAAFFCEPD